MFFNVFLLLETILGRHYVNFGSKRCGIPIEYTKYLKFVPKCVEYFVYSMCIPYFFTQKLHNVFLNMVSKVEKHWKTLYISMILNFGYLYVFI